MAQALSHPKTHVPKTYRVTISGDVSENQLNILRSGVTLDDDTVTLPADVVVHSRTESKTVLYVTLYEGKNRQIRRMCDSLGLNILLLKRISVGEISIGRMKPGEYRPLSRSELEKLFNSAGLPLPSFKSKEMKEKNENRSKVEKNRKTEELVTSGVLTNK